ncbi:MAG: hypothetical protein AAF598_04125 [Bacteroidota bacterium]
MKAGILIILCFLLLSNCGSVKSSLTSASVCTDCPTERDKFWNQWLMACAPGNVASSTRSDWSNTTFRTVGVTYEGFQAEDSLDHVAMVNLYTSEDLAQRFLPGVIRSGSDYPDPIVIKKGDYLSKLVKIGADISGFSVYYITPKELKRLMKNPGRIEQELGLPLTSNAGSYLEYRMYALQDNVVFQSHVAPTVQYASPDRAVYWTTGGAVQTLVLDNGDSARWKKSAVPSDTLKIETLPNINQAPNMN